MSLAVPLAVRLKTPKADVFVTREVRDLSFRSVIPGGYASAQLQLDRPLSVDADEIAAYGDMIIYDGRNGSVVWQGRMEDPGKGSGPDGQIWTVSAVGPSAHARDRTIPLIYVDRALDRWHHYVETGSTHPAGTQQVGEDLGGSGVEALLLHIPKGHTVQQFSLIGREYRYLREFGQKLARFDYTWDAGQTNTDWGIEAVTRGTGGDGVRRSQTHNTGGGGSLAKVVVTDFPNGNDLVEIRNIFLPFATGTVGDDNAWVSVMGLYVQAMRYNADGTEKTSGYTGFAILGSEIVADLLGRLLNQYDGANASIETTDYNGIIQLAYPQGVNAAEVFQDLMKFDPEFYWAAWEDTSTGKSRFEWRSWPTTVRYEVPLRTVDLQAPSSAHELYDSVNVLWKAVDGRQRRNRRTQTVQALTDAGITREATIDLEDQLGSTENADRAGDKFLQEHAIVPTTATLTVRGPVLDHDRGRLVQPWELVSGHLIRIRDLLPKPGSLSATARNGETIFKVMATNYSSGDNSCQLELDMLQSGVWAGPTGLGGWEQVVGRRMGSLGR